MNRMLTIDDLCEIFQVTPVTIARWVKQGALPPPVRIGRRIVRWREHDLAAFVAAMPQATPAEAQKEFAK
jgi:predicted DNA-binding transcriptional regulator AlpA